MSEKIIDLTECAQCGITKMFNTEGGILPDGRWFCSWSCRKALLNPTPKFIAVLVTPKPKIVCLCGSVRFRQEFDMVACQYTALGWVVVGPHCWNHAELHSEPGEEKKRMLDELHFRKIEMSDLVYIINIGGYIGNSTNRELWHARSLKKHIIFLEPWHQICDFAMEVQAKFGLKACCHPHQENTINQCQ